MTGREIRELRKKLGLTQEELARLLGVGFTTVNRWENEKVQPRGQALRMLEKLKELVEEAESREDINIEDLRKVLKEIESGKLVSSLAGLLPSSVLGLVAMGGIVGFVAGLSTAMVINKLRESNRRKK